MAGVKSVDHSKIMTASEVAKHLLNNCKTLALYESFMFGSSLLGSKRQRSTVLTLIY